MAGTLSAFFDESGQERRYQPDTKYYLLTIVLHDQSQPIADAIRSYEQGLSESSLPDVPFHAYDLFHARGGYAGLDFATRKKLFSRFTGFVRRLPITYKTFAYRRSEFADATALSDRMRRDLVSFVNDRLASFQSFDTVAIYYDGGQKAVRSAIRSAFDDALSVNTAEYKNLRYQERRLAQVADYFCYIELAALRYADHEETSNYLKVFGSARTFKANLLKQTRRKLQD
ncbi:MAG: DUF3800 domain-containing protein [Atopobiaceae bacterium]|nr:DUF3800 domain-containing protein [Atopobiaceae bacterium]